MARTIVVLELDYRDNVTGTTGTFRVATASYTTRPSDTPANTLIEGRLSAAPVITESLFDAGSNAVGGGSFPDFGEAEILNADGALDHWAELSIEGREARIYTLDPSAAYSTKTLVARTRVAGSVPSDRARIGGEVSSSSGTPIGGSRGTTKPGISFEETKDSKAQFSSSAAKKQRQARQELRAARDEAVYLNPDERERGLVRPPRGGRR